MKLQPRFQVGDKVLYNSLSNAGAAHGTIISINNEQEPHVYVIRSELFKNDPNKDDSVQDQHIQYKV